VDARRIVIERGEQRLDVLDGAEPGGAGQQLLGLRGQGKAFRIREESRVLRARRQDRGLRCLRTGAARQQQGCGGAGKSLEKPPARSADSREHRRSVTAPLRARQAALP
jgi:hypothetical protein